MSFRSFSPMPNTLEFHPGQDYYFISTASPGDMHRMVGGYCTSHNMKMVFKVLDSDSFGDTASDTRTEKEVKSKTLLKPPANSLSHSSTGQQYQEVEQPKLERSVTKPVPSGGPKTGVSPQVEKTPTTKMVGVTAVSSGAEEKVSMVFVILFSLLSVLSYVYTYHRGLV